MCPDLGRARFVTSPCTATSAKSASRVSLIRSVSVGDRLEHRGERVASGRGREPGHELDGSRGFGFLWRQSAAASLPPPPGQEKVEGVMTTADGTARGAWLAWLELGYPLLLAALGLGTALALAALAAGASRARPVARLLLRVALAGLAALTALLVAEAAVAASLAWCHRLPRLAMAGRGAADRRAGRGRADRGRRRVERRGRAVPRLALGRQDRRLEAAAADPPADVPCGGAGPAGWTLEQMQQRLAESARRPDLVILYAGHNEFASRYGWSADVPYYHDDPRAPWPCRLARSVAAHSPLCRLLAEALGREPVAARPPAQHRPLVDVPSYTAGQYAERLADFERRLEAMLADLKRAGVLTVLIVPPGNDAGFEPSRSVLPPETPRAARDAFCRGHGRGAGAGGNRPGRERRIPIAP